jgi:hypothetical protein
MRDRVSGRVEYQRSERRIPPARRLAEQIARPRARNIEGLSALDAE